MRVTELIARCHQIHEEHGDVDVVVRERAFHNADTLSSDVLEVVTVLPHGGAYFILDPGDDIEKCRDGLADADGDRGGDVCKVLSIFDR